MADDDRQIVEHQCLIYVVDLFPVATFLLDEEGTIVHTNRAATDIARRHDGLCIERKRLVPLRQAEAARLRELIANGASGGLRVSRSGAKHPYQVWVTHIPATKKAVCAGIVVLIVDPERKICHAEQILERFYELTPAEARLAAFLMNGCSLSEAAKSLDIRLQTAKSHLKKIFAKTHTQRQSELVRLLLQSAAALRLTESNVEFARK